MAQELEPRSLIAQYRIVSRIGSGGMGEVYLAEDTKLDRQVAIKVLHAELAKDDDRVRRFVLEAKAASGLNHPNILTIHEIGEFDGRHYIATELIKGETLRDRLRHGSLTLRDTIDIALQAASALNAAHEAGIVHRDIKPENIMIRDDGGVKILDFGLVKLSEPPASAGGQDVNSEEATRAQLNTAPGTVMGTATYMSPEQARGKDTDNRTDIWSLGVVLYEMVAGRTPFAGESPNDTIAAILKSEPDPLDAEIPHDLRRMIRRTLQKRSDERYQTVKDLLLDIRDLKRDLEFSEELERSHMPQQSRSSNVSTGQISENPTIYHSGSPSTHASLAPHPSSAEYIVSEIKQHKRAVLAVIGVVLTAFIGAGAYFYWFATPAAAAITSVAVLPFANASGDAEHEYLSDGISEAVINSLSQLKDLKVIARSSAFQYKGKEINLDDVAKALGVEAVVTGRVVKRGDQLQVSAELVKVSDKSQLWGETFTRAASAVGSLEAEISKQIAERLRIRLTNAEQQQIAKSANVNPQAHDLVLRGRFTASRSGNTKENLQKAIDLFNQAIAIEPGYAPAHVGIASSYSILVGNSLLDPKVGNPKAEEALRKALEFDDKLPAAYMMNGILEVNKWNWAEAEQSFKRALELNPNNASAHASFANLLDVRGRHDEAIASSRKAIDLDPAKLARRIDLAASLYIARRYDEAIDELRKVLEIDAESAIAHAYLGYAYTAKGEYEKAIAELKESMTIDGENSSDQCFMGVALARAGRRDEAQAILRELENSNEYVAPAELAILYTGLGEKEKAFAALERAFAARDLQMQYLGVDPNLNDLRPDPRFADLLRRVGLSR